MSIIKKKNVKSTKRVRYVVRCMNVEKHGWADVGISLTNDEVKKQIVLDTLIDGFVIPELDPVGIQELSKVIKEMLKTIKIM